MKPIKIKKVEGGWNIHVSHPDLSGVLAATNSGAWIIPDGVPIVIKTKEEARDIAHKIGRYKLHLGDFAETYIEGYGRR